MIEPLGEIDRLRGRDLTIKGVPFCRGSNRTDKGNRTFATPTGMTCIPDEREQELPE
jgi:hypothetical protein